MKNGNPIWKGLSWTSFLAAAVPLYMGFHKMFVYVNNEYYVAGNKNSYVGGDAYNYIINGNYATGFFVLATMLVIMGIGFAILYYLSKIADESNSSASAPYSLLNDIEENLPEL